MDLPKSFLHRLSTISLSFSSVSLQASHTLGTTEEVGHGKCYNSIQHTGLCTHKGRYGLMCKLWTSYIKTKLFTRIFVHLRTRFGDCRFKDGQNLTLFGDWREALDACRWDAQVIVEWEALAVQHLRPGEAERGHHGRAAVLDALAQRPARLYGLVQVVQAHGGEEGAEELSRVGVTLLLHQRDPRRRLLQNLVHGFVPEQVREAHLRVLDVVAQQQVWRDRLAVVLLVV